MWRLGVVMLLVLSCTAPSHPDARGPQAAPAGPVAPEVFTRICDSSVFGDLGAGWRRGQPAAGPVVFVAAGGYANDPPRLFRGRGDLATQQKVLTVVVGDRAVEISVRGDDAASTYDPSRWGDRTLVPFRRGQTGVRFEPCPEARSTQFNGGFLVRRPACVRVEVRPDDGVVESTTLSFGAGDCA